MYRLSFRAVVEGPTDESFFAPLLARALGEMRVDLVEPPVDVDVDTVVPRVVGHETRHDAIVRHVRESLSWVDVVFLHVDGTSQPQREQVKYLEPLRESWAVEPALPVLLPLVPVREMEAWALADRPLLEDLVRRRWADHEVFEGERLRRVEDLSDPKRTLSDVLGLHRRRGTSASAVDYLPLLAERISLDELKHVPSFATWWAQTRVSIRRVLEGES